jgi:thiamine transport system ATP-binding protein
VLALVGLTDLRDRRVAALSGGEQQRVALARALAVSPRFMMFDEPLGALDRAWRTRLLAEMRTLLASERLPALYVTHDQSEAFAIAARVAVMRDGRIVQAGAPADVWRTPADAWTATFLGFGPRFDAEVLGDQLHTPWGALSVRPDAPRGAVDVVLRSDAVRLVPDGPITARVASVAIEGSGVAITAEARSGPPLSLFVTHRDAPRLGEEIRVRIDPDALLVYARTAD